MLLRRMPATAILFLASCTDGFGGCGLTASLTPLPSPIPAESVIENGAAVRITNTGAAAVFARIKDLAASVTPDQCMPPDRYNVEGFAVCPSDPNEELPPSCAGRRGCRIARTITDVSFELDQSGEQSIVRAQVTMRLSGVIPLNASFGQTCDLFVDTTAVLPMRWAVDVDPTTRHANIVFLGTDPAPLEAQLVATMTMTAENGNNAPFGSICFAAGNTSVPAAAGLATALAGELAASQAIAFDDVLALVTTPMGKSGVANLDDSLAEAPRHQNVTLELSSIVGGTVRSETTHDVLGDDVAQRGFTGAVRTAFNSDATPQDTLDGRSTHHPCVPARVPPLAGDASPFLTGERILARSSSMASNARPGGAPYDVGFALSQSAINAMAFHLFNSGALCIATGTSTWGESLLSHTALSALPSLQTLQRATIHGGPLALQLELRPQTPPVVTIADAPLLNVHVADLALDVYAFVDEQPVRIFTATTTFDAELSATLKVASRQIELAAGTVSNVDVVITNRAFITEADAVVAAQIQTLMPLVVDAALAPVKTIDMPSAPLFALSLNDALLTHVDEGTESYLALFAALELP